MYIIAIIAALSLVYTFGKRIAKEREAQIRFNNRIAREQARQALEQAEAWEKQHREDAKRDAQIAKHEEQLRKMRFTMKQAEADIEHLDNMIGELDGILSYLKLEQSGTTPSSKEYVKYQSKIISLENRIHAAEAKLAKAKYTKSEAERKLA